MWTWVTGQEGRTGGRSSLGLVAIATATLVVLTACSTGGATESTARRGSAPAEGLAADQWVANWSDFEGAANWESAEVVRVDVGGGALTPAEFDLVAGQPYVIEISNSGPASRGVAAPDLFRAAAVGRTESGAEVKINQLSGVYANAGKTVELYLVPVFPATYPIVGIADGVPVAGLSGKITVSGSVPTAPAPVVEKVTSLGVPIGAADLVTAAIPKWKAKANAITIQMGDREGDEGTGFYDPEDITLKVGVPVTITFVNRGTVTHVYDCEHFLETAALWKIAGSDGYDTGAQARPAGVEAGRSTSLYVIPAIAGTYTLTHSAEGMEDASATIKVVTDAPEFSDHSGC